MQLPLSDLTFRELELFVMASKSHSLREVARQSGLLPAHVSKIMKKLENKVGNPLFKRSVSGVILTPEGIDLLTTAEKICEMAFELAPGNKAVDQKAEKLWTLGSISFLTTYLLAPVLSRYKILAKQKARFRLIEFTHNDLVAHGLKGAFDISVHIEDLEWTNAWSSYSLGAIKWKLYGRYGHPLSDTARESDVIKYDFIAPTDWNSHGYTLGEDHCPVGVRARKRGDEAATAETALELCRHSDQLTFIPEILAKNWCHFSLMKEITVTGWPSVEKEISLSVKADTVPRSLAEWLHKNLTAHLKLDG